MIIIHYLKLIKKYVGIKNSRLLRRKNNGPTNQPINKRINIIIEYHIEVPVVL